MDEHTAGFLVEPVQGEGGIRPASQALIKGPRELCDKNDLMLVFDEVQCGVARTGQLYAPEHYGVEPDPRASAPGLACRLPMGATLAPDIAPPAMASGTPA